MRGRGTAGKVPAFGILKRNGMVYAEIIPDTKTKTKTLKGIIDLQVHPDNAIYTDGCHPTIYSMCLNLRTIALTI